MSQDPKKNYSESKLMNALFARYTNDIFSLTNDILYLELPVLNICSIILFETL